MCGDARLTWGEVGDLVGRYTAGLRARGVGRGDRVGVLLLNCPEFLLLIQACMRIGAIFVPLNIRLTAPELAYILRDSDCAVFVSEHAFDDVTSQLSAELGVEWLHREDSLEQLLADNPADDAGEEVTWADPLILGYTSGTTGRPKGAILTHSNLMSIIVAALTTHNYTQQDRTLATFSLAFTGGVVAVWMPVYGAGGTLVIEREFDPARALDLLVREHITVVMGVPQIFERLTREPAWQDADLSALRVVSSGGAPVPRMLIEAYAERGIQLRPGYGLTEAGAMDVYMPPEHAERKLGSTGLTNPWLETMVIDEHGAEVADGVPGELLLRGPEVMSGYWRNPEASAAALAGGWLHTGDIVTRDGEGFITNVERKDDMYISGGINVYPTEVEHALLELGGITEAAIVGVPDQQWGQAGHAVVVLDGARQWTAEELQHELRERLAGYKVPRSITFVDALPRNMSGKLLKNELRDALARDARA